GPFSYSTLPIHQPCERSRCENRLTSGKNPDLRSRFAHGKRQYQNLSPTLRGIMLALLPSANTLWKRASTRTSIAWPSGKLTPPPTLIPKSVLELEPATPGMLLDDSNLKRYMPRPPIR